MKRAACLAGLIMLTSLMVPAQDKPITFKTNSEIVWAGVDRAGDLLLVLANGGVQKLDKSGKNLGTVKFKIPPTLLDPLDGTQSFYYNRDSSTYGNISADMTRVSTSHVDPSFAIRPWLISPALHELWILDAADFSIKKTQMKATMISLEAELKHLPTKQIKDFIYMREYQNYLFVLDQSSGVHMFNGLGKLIKTMGDKGLTYFSFLGEEIYFIQGKEIVLIDLYTNERRTLPLTTDSRLVLFTEDRQFSIHTMTVTISPFNP